MTADPIAAHVEELAGALRGPRRVRRCMLAEVRAGLSDAAEAYRAGGLAPAAAGRRAVADFGAVPEVAPDFQAELTARQGRASALLFALVFPGMMLGWDLLWSTGAVRWQVTRSELVPLLAGLLDLVSIIAGVSALGLLLGSFLRRVPPRWLAVAAGATGALGALVCGLIMVVLNLATGQGAPVTVLVNPVATAAVLGSIAVLGLLGGQAVRTLRVARAGQYPPGVAG